MRQRCKFEIFSFWEIGFLLFFVFFLRFLGLIFESLIFAMEFPNPSLQVWKIRYDRLENEAFGSDAIFQFIGFSRNSR